MKPQVGLTVLRTPPEKGGIFGFSAVDDGIKFVQVTDDVVGVIAVGQGLSCGIIPLFRIFVKVG